MTAPAKKAKQLQTAQKYISKGQYDRAIRELHKIVEADPKDVRIWLKIGDLHAKRGDNDSAVGTYLKVAGFYSNQGFHLKAIAVYRQILAIEPHRLEYNEKLAELYHHLALTREALDQLERVVSGHMAAGRSREALRALDRMVDVDPENIATRIRLAEYHSKQGDAQRAASQFGEAARRLQEAGRVDDYVKVAERLVFHNPQDTATLKRLAYIYIDRRDPKRALAKLRACFQVESNDAETLGLLAQAFKGIGQIPKTVQVLKELSAVLEREGRNNERDEVWRQILTLDPNDPDANQHLGRPVQQPQPRAAAPESDGLPGEAARTAPRPAPRPANLRRSDSGDVEFEVPRARAFGADQSDDLMLRDDEVEELSADDLEMVDDDAAYEPEPEPEPVEQPRQHGSSSGAAPTPEMGGPSSTDVARLLQETDIYIKYGLQEKAIAHVRRVFEHDAENASALQKLADLHVGNGSYEEAIPILVRLARSQDGAGRYDGAADALRRAAELDGSSPELRAYLKETGRLSEILGAGDDFEDEPTPVSQAAIRPDEMLRDAYESQVLAEEPDMDATPVPEPAPRRRVEADTPVFQPSSSIEIITGEFEDIDFDSVSDFISVGDSSLDPGTFSDITAPLSRDDMEARIEARIEGRIEARAEAPGTLRDAAARWEAPRPLDAEPELVDLSDGMDDEPEDTFRGTREELLGLDAVAPQAFPPSPTSEHSGAQDVDEAVSDSLDEAEFFVVQGLLDDARAIVQEALERYPSDQRLLNKQIELANLIASSGDHTMPARLPELVEEGARADSVGAEVDEHFARTLAEDMDAALDGFQPTRGTGATAIGVDDQVYRAFQVDNQQVEGDPETRFDLAIAYREMGMIEAAVEEFQQVINGGYRIAECWQLIGLCHMDRGDSDTAIAAYKHGLQAESARDEELTGLYYELGIAYESVSDLSEAIYYFDAVKGRHPGYRSVEDRLNSLRAREADSHASPLPVRTSHDDDEERMAAGPRTDDDPYYS